MFVFDFCILHTENDMNQHISPAKQNTLTDLFLCVLCRVFSIDVRWQFSLWAAEFHIQQGYAGQRAEMQEFLVNATQAGIQPACNNCPER